MNRNLELCLAKCHGSYRKGIELIAGIHRKGIHPKDQKQISQFLNSYTFKEDLFESVIK